MKCTNQRSFKIVCQGLVSCHRHIGTREDPGDEVVLICIPSYGPLAFLEKSVKSDAVALWLN